jgi:plastocyanin
MGKNPHFIKKAKISLLMLSILFLFTVSLVVILEKMNLITIPSNIIGVTTTIQSTPTTPPENIRSTEVTGGVVNIGRSRMKIMRDVSIFLDHFDPSNVNIKSGEKVKWTNIDEQLTEHELICVDSNDVQLFDVFLAKQETYEWAFYTLGDYACWDQIVGEKMGMIISVT